VYYTVLFPAPLSSRHPLTPTVVIGTAIYKASYARPG